MNKKSHTLSKKGSTHKTNKYIKDKRNADKELDKTLESTFPASDATAKY